MKVVRIEINDFRGFPGPGSYNFICGGKNLLLFGENGSGKSSLLIALKEFFNRSGTSAAFSSFRNVFTFAGGVPLTSGKISVEFDDNSGEHTWDIVSNIRPLADPPVNAAALRFGSLDYRMMLAFTSANNAGGLDLFSALIDGVLRRMPVVVNGLTTTFGHLLDQMRQAKPRRHTVRTMQFVQGACDRLNTAIQNFLPAVLAEANHLMNTFHHQGVTFQLVPGTITYSRASRTFLNMRITCAVQLYGFAPVEPQRFLNEARLSALAIAIFLAALKVSIPPAPPGMPIPAKLLVLDDILIGLDMSHRHPLLDLLTARFSDWQVLLLTHDQAWYSLAKKHLESPKWTFARLATGFDGQRDLPILYDDTRWIDRAEDFLNRHGDERAAGVYLRLAFEEMLKTFCATCQLEVPYLPPHRHPNTNMFWKPILKVQVGRGKLIPASLEYDIEQSRSNVANPLCHYGNDLPLRAEVQNAIKTLRWLDTTLEQYKREMDIKSPPSVSILDAAIEDLLAPPGILSLRIAAIHLRGAFDEAVTRLASRKRISVTYNRQLTDYSPATLWRTMLPLPSNLRGVYASQVAAIHAHSSFFLAPLDLPTVSALSTATFLSALSALEPAMTARGSPASTWMDRIP